MLGKWVVEVPRQTSLPERACNAAAAALWPLGGSQGPGNQPGQEGCWRRQIPKGCSDWTTQASSYVGVRRRNFSTEGLITCYTEGPNGTPGSLEGKGEGLRAREEEVCPRNPAL